MTKDGIIWFVYHLLIGILLGCLMGFTLNIVDHGSIF